jgi:zinc finger SWIM domain-containing protein 3
VADKRDEEVKYDFKATQSRLALKPDLKILRHPAKVYMILMPKGRTK